MTKKLKLLSSSFIMTLTLAMPLVTYAMEPDEDHHVVHAPAPKEEPKVEDVSANTDRYFSIFAYFGHEDALGCDQPILEALYYLTPLRHFDGDLIFTDPTSSEEKKLRTPYQGTVDLSACGVIANHVTFTTNPYVFFAIDNANPRLNILVASHSVIKKLVEKDEEIKTFFGRVVNAWDQHIAPIGIFWRMSTVGDRSDYDYLVTATAKEISSRNLYENWWKSAHGGGHKFRSMAGAFRLILE